MDSGNHTPLETYQIDYLNDTILDLARDIQKQIPSAQDIKTIFSMLCQKQSGDSIIAAILARSENELDKTAQKAINHLALLINNPAQSGYIDHARWALNKNGYTFISTHSVTKLQEIYEASEELYDKLLSKERQQNAQAANNQNQPVQHAPEKYNDYEFKKFISHKDGYDKAMGVLLNKRKKSKFTAKQLRLLIEKYHRKELINVIFDDPLLIVTLFQNSEDELIALAKTNWKFAKHLIQIKIKDSADVAWLSNGDLFTLVKRHQYYLQSKNDYTFLIIQILSKNKQKPFLSDDDIFNLISHVEIAAYILTQGKQPVVDLSNAKILNKLVSSVKLSNLEPEFIINNFLVVADKRDAITPQNLASIVLSSKKTLNFTIANLLHLLPLQAKIRVLKIGKPTTSFYWSEPQSVRLNKDQCFAIQKSINATEVPDEDFEDYVKCLPAEQQSKLLMDSRPQIINKMNAIDLFQRLRIAEKNQLVAKYLELAKSQNYAGMLHTHLINFLNGRPNLYEQDCKVVHDSLLQAIDGIIDWEVVTRNPTLIPYVIDNFAKWRPHFRNPDKFVSHLYRKADLKTRSRMEQDPALKDLVKHAFEENQRPSPLSYASKPPALSTARPSLTPKPKSYNITSNTYLDSDHLFKLRLAGDAGVGKSSLLLRFTDDIFSDNFISTIGVDFKIRQINLRGQRIKLQIWDIAGSDRFRTIESQHHRGFHGVIFLFDTTDQVSFNNVKFHLKESERYSFSGACRLLVGTKSDLKAKRVVELEVIKSFADQYGLLYIETSAKTDYNVDLAFTKMAELICDKGKIFAPKPERPTAKSKDISNSTVLKSLKELQTTINKLATLDEIATYFDSFYESHLKNAQLSRAERKVWHDIQNYAIKVIETETSSFDTAERNAYLKKAMQYSLFNKHIDPVHFSMFRSPTALGVKKLRKLMAKQPAHKKPSDIQIKRINFNS